MKQINYPLIISDFDGTLLRSDQTIDEKTRLTIEQYTAAGGVFAICTGRTPRSILPRAKELGLKGLISSFQGSVILDAETGKLIRDGGMETSLAISVCKKMEEMNLHIHVYDVNEYYSNEGGEILEMYEKISGVKGVVAQKPLSKLIEEKGMKVRKLIAIVAPEDRQRVVDTLSAAFHGKCYVTYSTSFLIEISSPKYTKGSAVRFIAEHYGIPIEKTVAIGDSLNDLPMLQSAGIGIAVKNAEAALKKEALVCEYTNDENAVGKIIEKYGYKEDM